MTDVTLSFDDSEAYERFIGQWGRAAGALFLAWLEPAPGARWLDVGCGTGLFTELILDRCAPASVIAIDQAPAQIGHARSKPVSKRADFRIGDAQALPFADDTFDVVASALVVNFIPDRLRALSEMRRVAASGSLVASYVWDFAEELSPSGPFRRGLRDVVPELPVLPGAEDSRRSALAALFERAELDAITTRSFEVTVSFPHFDAFWAAQTPGYAPTTKLLAAMTPGDRERVIEAVHARLSPSAEGRIEYRARANAIKARVPG